MNEHVFLDSCVLIGYLSPTSVWHKRSVKFIKDHIGAIISPYVLNEVHYIIQKYNGAETANKTIINLLDFQNIQLLDFEFDRDDLKSIFRISSKYKLKTFDSFHAYYCKKAGIKKIVSFDMDFIKVKFLKLVVPD
ncbi:hypothetical protein A2982_01750 [candidate division WWE3 bacterium RIFCSPLOWO2_01_FULL_39_13]|uniref:PIN domain-containing protein n=1 Tax=candidate division WWE3 bacterium RIFCSPLOWO2_01_FULL_39_13 TaxID=1802624 RepID=A0A1F4V565_UNCKA|nr:MAG: hypothetical protein A2982_01750 [candidate division WWE3 bacterium RIFCSPLOWO2_01_FULL_39_13]